MQTLIRQLLPSLKFLFAADVERLLTAHRGGLTRDLLRPGNEKLSTRILTFGLPAVLTCPGRTDLCGGDEARCYATRSHYLLANVARPREENFVLAHRNDFADLVLDELYNRHDQSVVRPHDSGDLFSAFYAEAWYRVMAAARRSHRFFLFSRSWRVAEVRPVLARMARLPNVRVWYSIDRETGWPARLPKRARLAYMMVDEWDFPARPVDLVFKDQCIRGRPTKRVGGSLVCPYENGATRDNRTGGKLFNCHKCGLCWDDLAGPMDPRNHFEAAGPTLGRLPLQVVPA